MNLHFKVRCFLQETMSSKNKTDGEHGENDVEESQNGFIRNDEYSNEEDTDGNEISSESETDYFYDAEDEPVQENVITSSGVNIS